MENVKISQLAVIANSLDSDSASSMNTVQGVLNIISVLLMDDGVNPFNVVMLDAFQDYIRKHGDKDIMTAEEIQPHLPICVSLAEHRELFHEVSFNNSIRYIARIKK